MFEKYWANVILLLEKHYSKRFSFFFAERYGALLSELPPSRPLGKENSSGDVDLPFLRRVREVGPRRGRATLRESADEDCSSTTFSTDRL